MTRIVTRSLRTFGMALALSALTLTLATGCGLEESNGNGLFGKLGKSLGTVARGETPAAPATQTETAEPGSSTDPASIPASSSCQRACDHIVSCLTSACPALGTVAEDLGGVTAECRTVCDEVATDDVATQIAGLACHDVLGELVSDEPELAQVCGVEGTDREDDDSGDDDSDDDSDDDDDDDDDGGYYSDDDWDEDDWDEDDWDEDYEYGDDEGCDF